MDTRAEQHTGKKRGRPKGSKTRNPSIKEYISEIDGTQRFVVVVPETLQPLNHNSIPNLETKTKQILKKLAALRTSVQNDASAHRQYRVNPKIKNKLDRLDAESQAALIALRAEETEQKRLARANPEHIRTHREKLLLAVGKLTYQNDKQKKLDAALQAIDASFKQKKNALNATFSAKRRAFEEELKTGNALEKKKLDAINEKKDEYTRLLQTKRNHARRQINVRPHQHQQHQRHQHQMRATTPLVAGLQQALYQQQYLEQKNARKQASIVGERIAREAAVRQNASAANQRGQIARKKTDLLEFQQKVLSRGQMITGLLSTLETGALNNRRAKDFESLMALMDANKTNRDSIEHMKKEIEHMEKSLRDTQAISTALSRGDQRGGNQKTEAARAASAAKKAREAQRYWQQ
jgi:hypothetical protein